MSKWTLRFLLLLVIVLIGAAGYVSMQEFSAPTQSIQQELSREMFLSAQ